MVMRRNKKVGELAAAPAYEDHWRAEDDLRTLMNAEEIKSDPKRLKAAMACAEEKKAALASVSAEAAEDAKEKKK